MRPKTRFTSLDEFYEAMPVLIEWLQREGHVEEAQALETVMHAAWTTGSELIGEIMLVLKNRKGNYSPPLKREMDECYEFALHHRKITGLR